MVYICCNDQTPQTAATSCARTAERRVNALQHEKDAVAREKQELQQRAARLEDDLVCVCARVCMCVVGMTIAALLWWC